MFIKHNYPTPYRIQQPQPSQQQRFLDRQDEEIATPKTPTMTPQQMYTAGKQWGRAGQSGFEALQNQSALGNQLAGTGVNAGNVLGQFGIDPTQAQMLAAQDVGLAGTAGTMAPETMSALVGEVTPNVAAAAAPAAGAGLSAGAAAGISSAIPWVLPAIYTLDQLFSRD